MSCRHDFRPISELRHIPFHSKSGSRSSCSRNASRCHPTPDCAIALVATSILRFHRALRPPGRHHKRPEPLPRCGGRELLPAHGRLQNRAAANRRRLHDHAGHDSERRRPVLDHGGTRAAGRHAYTLPAGAQQVATEDRGESSGTTAGRLAIPLRLTGVTRWGYYSRNSAPAVLRIVIMSCTARDGVNVHEASGPDTPTP